MFIPEREIECLLWENDDYSDYSGGKKTFGVVKAPFLINQDDQKDTRDGFILPSRPALLVAAGSFARRQRVAKSL